MQARRSRLFECKNRGVFREPLRLQERPGQHGMASIDRQTRSILFRPPAISESLSMLRLLKRILKGEAATSHIYIPIP
jgi:hypothetical protein